ncbi:MULTISPECIES: tetratricopeptide repeat protein [unclassified Parabacteroides]|uniref:tetratricopeptide repeat protein n=1 Tax=unclassified Parabacteroides TaxID=2649774 RepID=UPI0013D7D4DA|nr:MULTISPECIES: tetratricopeptide repeat protein [unclassified Parabacteroides]
MMAYYYYGRILQDVGDALQAQNYYLKALEYGKNSDNTAVLLRICNTLGMLYCKQEAYELAIPHFKQALSHIEVLGDSVYRSFSLRNIGRVYRQLDSIELSIRYYKEALNYANAYSSPSILLELGSNYTEVEKYDTAYIFLQQALSLSVDSMDYFPACLTLGEYFTQIGKVDSAMYYLNESKRSHIVNTEAASYFYLAKIARRKYQYEEMLLLNDKYDELRDTITNQNHAESIRRMQHLYNYKWVEQEADLYKLKHIANQRKIYILVLSTLWILFLCSFFFIYLHRRQKKWIIQYKNLLHSLEDSQLRKETNEKRIKELEKELITSKGTEAELLSIEMQILEHNNQQLDQEKEEREKLNQIFHKSDIYNLYHSNNRLGEITEEHKEKLIQTIDKIYPEFRKKIKNIIPKITPKEIELCYYMKADIIQTDISKLTSESAANIGMRQKRLYEKMKKRGISLPDLKSVVSALC